MGETAEWQSLTSAAGGSGVQMVEMASSKFVCIVDDTKLVKGLGGSGGEHRFSCPKLLLPQWLLST